MAFFEALPVKERWFTNRRPLPLRSLFSAPKAPEGLANRFVQVKTVTNVAGFFTLETASITGAGGVMEISPPEAGIRW